jgi:hypothetical protein
MNHHHTTTTIPQLTEPGVVGFLQNKLRSCHEIKMYYFNFVFNLFLSLLFLFLFCSILIYKYKGKPSEEELEKREQEKHKYILNKIKQLQETESRQKQDLITNLPLWNDFSL